MCLYILNSVYRGRANSPRLCLFFHEEIIYTTRKKVRDKVLRKQNNCIFVKSYSYSYRIFADVRVL